MDAFNGSQSKSYHVFLEITKTKRVNQLAKTALKIQSVKTQAPLNALRVALVKNRMKVVLDVPRAMLGKQEHHVLPAFLVCTAKAKMMMVLLLMVRRVLRVQLGIPPRKEVPNVKHAKLANTATPLVPVIANHV